VSQICPGWHVGVAVGHPGGIGHRVGVAVFPPLGNPTPLTGNAAGLFPAPFIPATAATVLSSAITIAAANTRNPRYSLVFLWMPPSFSISSPSCLHCR
jgi:hypothetical protein